MASNSWSCCSGEAAHYGGSTWQSTTAQLMARGERPEKDGSRCGPLSFPKVTPQRLQTSRRHPTGVLFGSVLFFDIVYFVDFKIGPFNIC